MPWKDAAIDKSGWALRAPKEKWGVGTRNGDSHAEQHVTDKGLNDDDDDDDHYRGPRLEQVTAM